MTLLKTYFRQANCLRFILWEWIYLEDHPISVNAQKRSGWSNSLNYTPRKLTWIPKIMVWKRWLLLDMAIFGTVSMFRFLGWDYLLSGVPSSKYLPKKIIKKKPSFHLQGFIVLLKLWQHGTPRPSVPWCNWLPKNTHTPYSPEDLIWNLKI